MDRRTFIGGMAAFGAASALPALPSPANAGTVAAREPCYIDRCVAISRGVAAGGRFDFEYVLRQVIHATYRPSFQPDQKFYALSSVGLPVGQFLQVWIVALDSHGRSMEAADALLGALERKALGGRWYDGHWVPNGVAL